MFKLTLVFKDNCREEAHMMGSVVQYWSIDRKRLWLGFDNDDANDDFYHLEDLDTIRIDGEIVWQDRT